MYRPALLPKVSGISQKSRDPLGTNPGDIEDFFYSFLGLDLRESGRRDGAWFSQKSCSFALLWRATFFALGRGLRVAG